MTRSFDPMTQWWRLGGILGIIFVVLFLIGGFVLQGDSPGYKDSIGDIRG